MSRVLVLRPPAKINLTLRVGPARGDGFHDVRTLLQAVALSDTLTVTARRGPFALAAGGPGVPTDDTNLVSRAATALWRALGREGEPRDAHVKLVKQIPMAAGLGGGSADAAAALIALNVVWDGHRSRRDLARIGGTLGADVPFFLQGGTALGAGRGDEIYPVDDAARMGVVIIKPSFGVATADAYRWLDEDRAAGVDAPAASRDVEVGWASGPIALVNDLQGPVARRHAPVAEIVDALTKAGALGAAMTGSGSAVFGLFPEAQAPRAARRLKRADWLVQVTRTLSRRESARRLGL
ncbi:MAG TPA: 4-(cytidine 5'-diphospho)-2-C-methyl-D-erythritol kinase [Vicinamibacterales bacterium]|nr:4-(cytidine 5'-diphospho)-2-C-methyl-D-erythritol kinase [Vicinamibacterales bacterium]